MESDYRTSAKNAVETQFSRRRFLGLAGGAVASTLLAACGDRVDLSTPTAETGGGSEPTSVSNTTPEVSSSEASPTTVSEDTTTQTTLETVGNYDFAPSLKRGVSLRYQTFWAQYRIDILQPALDDFTQRTGVEVVVESIPGGDYRTSLATTMAGGTTADVFIADIWNMVKYYDAGMILDLTERVEADGIDLANEYGLVGLERYCDKIYMLPFVLSPHAWYYNKTMLAEVGALDPWDDLNGEWTFDDFRDIALTVKEAGLPNVWGAQLGATVEYNWDPILRTFGGAPTDFSASPPQYTIGSPETIEALEMLRQWYREDEIILPPDQSRALDDQGVTSPFASKLVAMFENSTGQVAFIAQNVSDFEWDIAPPLRKSADTSPIGHSDGDPNAVSASTQHPDEAYALIKHLAGPVTQEILARNKLLTPAFRPAAESDFYLESPPEHMHVFADVLAGSYTTSFYHGNGLQASRDMTNFAEELVLGSRQPEDAQALQDEINRLVEFGDCVPTYVGG